MKSSQTSLEPWMLWQWNECILKVWEDICNSYNCGQLISRTYFWETTTTKSNMNQQTLKTTQQLGRIASSWLVPLQKGCPSGQKRRQSALSLIEHMQSDNAIADPHHTTVPKRRSPHQSNTAERMWSQVPHWVCIGSTISVIFLGELLLGQQSLKTVWMYRDQVISISIPIYRYRYI